MQTNEQQMEFLTGKLEEAREAEPAARAAYEESLLTGGVEGQDLEPGAAEAAWELAKKEVARYETAIMVLRRKMDADRAAAKADQAKAAAEQYQRTKRTLLKVGQDMDAVLADLSVKMEAFRRASAAVEEGGNEIDKSQLRNAVGSLGNYIKFAMGGVRATGTFLAMLLREKKFSERLPQPEPEERTA